MVSSTSRAALGVQHGGGLVQDDALRLHGDDARQWPPAASARRRACGARGRRYSYMPTAFRASSTRRRISSGGTPRFSGPKATSSSTTPATSWLSGFCSTNPTRRRTSSWVSSTAGVDAVHQHFPGGGQQHPVEQLGHGGFSTAVVPQAGPRTPLPQWRGLPRVGLRGHPPTLGHRKSAPVGLR